MSNNKLATIQQEVLYFRRIKLFIALPNGMASSIENSRIWNHSSWQQSTIASFLARLTWKADDGDDIKDFLESVEHSVHYLRVAIPNCLAMASLMQ